jgi:hypothetical protein
VGVRTLVEATGGDIDASARYRDIFRRSCCFRG